MTSAAGSVDPVSFFADVRRQLEGLPTELLGEYRAAKRVLGIARAPRIAPIGEAWHLGALLVTADAVLATGDVARSLEPSRKGYTAISARERDELRFAAYRGGVPEGRAVHYNWSPIDLAALASTGTAGPLTVQEGELRIRWSAAGGYAPLHGYVRERIDLARGVS